MGTAASELVDLKALGADFDRDPYPVYASLRDRGPVHRVRMPEGAEAYLVVGHQEVRTALNDARLSKDWRHASHDLGVSRVAPGVHMLESDPPHHTRLRKLVTREFTGRRVAALAPRVQRMADDFVDELLAAPRGPVDLVDTLAFPLPIGVICELLGVPDLDRASFRQWSNIALGAADAARKLAVTTRVTEYLHDLLAAKRQRPGADLMSALIRTTDEDGDRLSRDELVGMAWLLLVAGHETTVNLISNGVLALLTHPDQLAALRADRSLLEPAVEETLRYDGPVETPTYRFATESVEIAGTVIDAGELVLPVLADADRDPGRFDEPRRFDIRRDARGHLAFGHGIHYCLGAPLARLEARIAIGTLVDRCPGLALAVHPAALPYRSGMLIRGPERLPVSVR